MLHTRRVTPAATPSHVRIRDMDRAGFLRPAFLPEACFMRPHSSTTRHSQGGKLGQQPDLSGPPLTNCAAEERMRRIRLT